MNYKNNIKKGQEKRRYQDQKLYKSPDKSSIGNKSLKQSKKRVTTAYRIQLSREITHLKVHSVVNKK